MGCVAKLYNNRRFAFYMGLDEYTKYFNISNNLLWLILEIFILNKKFEFYLFYIYGVGVSFLNYLLQVMFEILLTKVMILISKFHSVFHFMCDSPNI